jgi:hypothetical protein
MPTLVRTSALMISTFSVSITMFGSRFSRTKNSSRARRVFEPLSNEHEVLAAQIVGDDARACGRADASAR